MKIKILTLIILFSGSSVAISELPDTEFDSSNNQALASNNFSIRKHTISSGGGVSTGGNFSITSSIGQIDAGHNATGGDFTIRGGFLQQRQQNTDLIFKNSFE